MFRSFDWTAFGFALFVFGLALSMAWALGRYKITDSLGFVMIVVLPIAAYGIASGYVAKITVPGGWAAEFRAVATDTIKPSRLEDEVQDLSIFEKADPAQIEEYRRQIEVGKPIAISLSLGRVGYYSPHVIGEYVRTFLVYDPDLTVIFLDPAGKFVASTNGNALLAALSLQGFDQMLSNAIETGDLDRIAELVVFSREFVVDETTNAEALRKMVAAGVDSIIKIDASGLPIGLVRRDEIISRLMVKLAES